MKNFLEGKFSKLALKMDEQRRAAISDVITELRGDLSNSIQFLTSVQVRELHYRDIRLQCHRR